MKRGIVFLFLLVVPVISFGQNIIGGIGAQLFIDTAGGTNMPRVMSLVDNSPAVGKLKATDFIMSVNGVNCKNKTIEDVVALIRGEAGTSVHVVVADTKLGDHPREYDITRVSIQIGNDPVAGFNSWGDNEAKQLKKKGFEIVKTFTSDCGNYFFNFNADAGGYRANLYTMEEKMPGSPNPAFKVSAKIYDGNNEQGAVTLTGIAPLEAGNIFIGQSGGTITFPRDCVGMISTTISDDAKKCKAMYLIVYK